MTKIFKEIGEAYAILSDPKQKIRYDDGDDIVDGGWDLDEEGNIDAESIWEAFFGGGMGTSTCVFVN